MISLITPTGGRPAAFALCEKWMSRQTKRWDRWIVVDDCEPRTPCTMGQEVICPERVWKPGDDSQRDNMRLALAAVEPGSDVFIIEDDDYYGPCYLEYMSGWLAKCSVIGIAPTRYYHASLRAYHVFDNLRHASLCQTAFAWEQLPRMVEATKGTREQYIDMMFWGSVERDDLPRIFINLPIAIGIKGLPGRRGVVDAHRGKGMKDDPKGEMLRTWIGADADEYLKDWGNVTRWERDGVRYRRIEQVING